MAKICGYLWIFLVRNISGALPFAGRGVIRQRSAFRFNF
jgi:hypothetical protein